MINYHIGGYSICYADLKAFEHMCLVTPDQWASDALKGLVNKAKKTIIRDYLDIYRRKTNDPIPTDPAALIPLLVSMEEFKPYNHKSPEKRIPERRHKRLVTIWKNGFQLEDWEDMALRAFYENPELTIKELMENRFSLLKQDFYKEIANDKANSTIPPAHDDAIRMQVSKQGYKNRAQREAEDVVG